MRAWPVLAGVLMLAGPGAASAWTSPAPDVVLYCPPALDQVLHEAAARFRAERHVAVHVFVAPPSGLAGLLRHRARADVVVADATTMQALITAKLVSAASIVALGADPYVLIGPAGQPAGAAAALIARHAVALPDPTTAASFDGAAVLRAMAARPVLLIGVADTPEVIEVVRAQAGTLGLVRATEAAADGVMAVAPVPVAPVPMQAALVSQGQSGQAAALIGFIAGADGMALLRSAGMTP